MKTPTPCTGLYTHSLSDRNMRTIDRTKEYIRRMCKVCGYAEVLPHSQKRILFPNNLVMQKKRWGHDQTTKELLQPQNPDGSINDEFTEAYGFNPFVEETKHLTPKVQGGTKEAL